MRGDLGSIFALHFFIYFVIGILIFVVMKRIFGRKSCPFCLMIVLSIFGAGSLYEIARFYVFVMYRTIEALDYLGLILNLVANFLGIFGGAWMMKKFSECRKL